MLHWRLLLGVLIIAALVGLFWLDYAIPLPGAVLLPVALVLVAMATGEVIELLAAAGMRPSPGPVYAANLLMLLAAWGPFCHWHYSAAPASWLEDGGIRSPATLDDLALNCLSFWILLTLALAVLLIFAAEMRRYEKPGRSTKAAAAGVFAVVYVGVLMSFVVSLRMAWGVAALASMLIVVKLGDTGAYTVGRLVGRHKMAPTLSPGKTIEGAAGAFVFSAIGSWATFRWLVPAVAGGSASAASAGWGWLAYGLAVSAAGMLGDLAESLLKRDAGLKDSSRWLPGFGGILDLLDSIFLAAPVAYAFWALGWVG